MGENNVERNRKVETREVEFRRSLPSCVVTSSMFQRQNLSQVWVWCRGDLNFYTCCTVPHMSYDIFRQQKATQQLRFTWECAQGLHLYSQKLSLNFTSILTKAFPQFHIYTHRNFPSICPSLKSRSSDSCLEILPWNQGMSTWRFCATRFTSVSLIGPKALFMSALCHRKKHH